MSSPAPSGHNLPRIYLAGPDVFRRDARAEGDRIKGLCADAGLKGMFPLDNLPPNTAAETIRERCIADIRLCDAVVANISPFRGPHMDPGTAWELGFAEALGKPIFLWSAQTQPMRARIAAEPHDDGWRDADGHTVEDFGATENLMITLAETRVHARPEDAIRAAAALLRPDHPIPAAQPRFRLGLLQMIGIAAAVAFAAGYLGDKFLFK